MALKEQWEIRRSTMKPPVLKYVALALAMMFDPEKGDNIFISVDELAQDTGLHRATVSRQLATLDDLDIFPVGRRGGRHLNARGEVVTHTSTRSYNPAALERAFGPSRAGRPDGVDQVAESDV